MSLSDALNKSSFKSNSINITSHEKDIHSQNKKKTNTSENEGLEQSRTSVFSNTSKYTSKGLFEMNKSLIHINFKYLTDFNKIEEILKVFTKNKVTNKFSQEEILQVLNANSFNIRNSYLQLKRGNKAHFSFTQPEDYIIKFMSDSDLFMNLCLIKGTKNVMKRKEYLCGEE
ncbi:MAG: hypothetical protein MJ252_30210 [archaeon]|nr:hypothetical protein [archaeon]